jgi:hypothetical protein
MTLRQVFGLQQFTGFTGCNWLILNVLLLFVPRIELFYFGLATVVLVPLTGMGKTFTWHLRKRDILAVHNGF